ncbi:cation channel sperm-associated protein 1 [Meriones unguiculatus]|uniref:cation channel sperm-associated protein 1 n=1 Tax=Meriones unguiculatus TaxID=10047 RepID=UPI000B4EE6FE|nr:cation channel sperm-associated protein 1 [Meriones unguiculatus]
MDKRPSRMRMDTSKVDMRHRSHSPSFYPHHRPNQSGANKQQHGGFHNQNEAHPLHEFPDYYDNAFPQRTHHQTRSHVATTPHYGGGPQRGSIPRAEPHPRGGSRGGTQPHSELHRHAASRGGAQPHSELHRHAATRGTAQPHAGTYHNEPYHPGRQHPQGGHPYQGTQRQSDSLSHTSVGSYTQRDAPHGKFPYGGMQHRHGEPHQQAHHHGRPHIPYRGQTHMRDPYRGFQDSYQGRHQLQGVPSQSSYFQHREYGPRHSQSGSQIPSTYMSHSTIQMSHSHLGTRSSGFSMARSHLTSRSRVSSKIHPKEDSWSDDEQIQKRKKTQRTHKKLHSGNIFQLILDKINTLIWGLREMMMSLTQSLAFETFIFLVVCLNSVILVAQTFTELEIRGEWYFMVLDSIFLAIYVVEALLKLIALGVEYFYDPWNNLDFFIMVMAVLDFVLLQINSLSYSFYNHSLFRILKVFKSMRALRAIRVLRRLSILTSLHEVTGTLSGSLPSITAILTLMFTCIFLFSVVLRALFRKSDPKRFQNIFTTLFTLFTMLTLDDWSIIYMDSRAQGAWYIIPILMIYIIIQYFIFLNLVIAVLVDNFQMALLRGLEKVKMEKAARVHEKLLDDSLTELTQADTDAQMSESALQMQFIDRMFGNMTERQRGLHFQFLQLVAAVELHQQKFRSQASVIDEIVDTAFEAGEDDYGK